MMGLDVDRVCSETNVSLMQGIHSNDDRDLVLHSPLHSIEDSNSIGKIELLVRQSERCTAKREWISIDTETGEKETYSQPVTRWTGASRRRKHLSWISAASSPPTPPDRPASCTTIQRPVLLTDLTIVSIWRFPSAWIRRALTRERTNVVRLDSPQVNQLDAQRSDIFRNESLKVLCRSLEECERRLDSIQRRSIRDDREIRSCL